MKTCFPNELLHVSIKDFKRDLKLKNRYVVGNITVFITTTIKTSVTCCNLTPSEWQHAYFIVNQTTSHLDDEREVKCEDENKV